MGKEFRRYSKYVVIKTSDVEKHLCETERIMLDSILEKVALGRQQEGRNPHKEYVVVSQDMPYAEKVWSLIQEYWEANNG